MSNYASDIEEAAGGEPIRAVVIEADMCGWGDYQKDERHDPAWQRAGEVLTWDEARPLLDFEYDTGFGAPDCPDMTAWTDSRVLFVHEYDGSTHIYSVPRNPEASA